MQQIKESEHTLSGEPLDDDSESDLRNGDEDEEHIEWWSVDSVCELLNVSNNRLKTLDNYIATGYFPAAAKGEGRQRQWHDSDIVRWQAWRKADKRRVSFRGWKQCEMEGFQS